MRYFHFLLFLTLVLMSHVTNAAPSTDLKPHSIEFSTLAPHEVPPTSGTRSFIGMRSYTLGFGYFSGYLLDSETQKSGVFIQGAIKDWIKAQIMDSNILGLQFGISIFSQKIFIGSYLVGNDQLANFVDYRRFKFTFNFNLLSTDSRNSRWGLDLDLGYGYLGYLIAILTHWSF